MCCPSATFAVWSAAWLHGAAASDNALDALLTWGEAHEVVAFDDDSADALGLPAPGAVPAGMGQLFPVLRRAGVTGTRLVLPAPGDVRGLGGTGPFPAAALRAGEAVVLTGAGYGVVPESIAEGLMRWTLYPMTAEPPPEHLSLPNVEAALLDAIRDSAGALRTLDVKSDRPGVHAELSAKLHAAPRTDWPPGTPGRALRVLQRAEEVGAILALADADDPGGALSASAAGLRAEALRPLANAVRLARCGAINEAVRTLASSSENS